MPTLPSGRTPGLASTVNYPEDHAAEALPAVAHCGLKRPERKGDQWCVSVNCSHHEQCSVGSEIVGRHLSWDTQRRCKVRRNDLSIEHLLATMKDDTKLPVKNHSCGVRQHDS